MTVSPSLEVRGTAASGAAVEPRYDVFLSFAGPDRKTGRDLAATLRSLGLRVFLDEDDIDDFHGITATLERALSSSKSLVAYYSAEYAARPACQLELMTAFLAGLREGNPLRRVVVINPERSTGHLLPVELADAKYALPPTTALATEGLARKIQRRTAALAGTIGEVSLKTHQRWFGRKITGGAGISGRYRELWSLHSALHSADFPLFLETYHGTSVAVCGLPGAGKTALAEAYAWQFGAAYPGGVYWLSLAGARGSNSDDVRRRFRGEVRRIARALGIDPSDRHDVVAAVANHLAGDARPSLWIVDDVPSHLDSSVLDGLLLPAGPTVRTILISEENIFGAMLPVVEVGPLAPEDARAVLFQRRLPDGRAEREACDRIGRALGYHVGAVVEAGNHLQDRQELMSYAEFDAAVTSVSTLLPNTTAALRPMLERLTKDELFVLHVAALCRHPVLPARLLKQVGACHEADIGTALMQLRRRTIATRADTTWRLHPLVVMLQPPPSYLTAIRLRATITEAVLHLAQDRRKDKPENAAIKWIANSLAQYELPEPKKKELTKIAHVSPEQGKVLPPNAVYHSGL